MRILLGEELLDLDEETLNYMFLDEGNESEVFRYGDSALKIYKPHCSKSRLGLDDVIELSKIPTKRFLMPREVIRDADTLEFIGYSLPFVYKYPRDILMRIKMNDFLDELDVIHSDLELLAQHHVDIEDVHIDNVLFNQFIKNDVFPLAKLSKKKKKELDEMFDDYFFIGGQMRYSIPPKETVRQYIKRMTQ